MWLRMYRKGWCWENVLRIHACARRLVKLLEQLMAPPRNETSKILIFTETKLACDQLTKSLRQVCARPRAKLKRSRAGTRVAQDGWPALCIHGDKQQQETPAAAAQE